MMLTENIGKIKLKQAEADKLGITLPLFSICQNIFHHLNKMNKSDGVTFLEDISNSIGGKDLSKLHWTFLKDCLEHLPKQRPSIDGTINWIIAGLLLLAQGKEWPDVDTPFVASRFSTDTSSAGINTFSVVMTANWAADAAREAPYGGPNELVAQSSSYASNWAVISAKPSSYDEVLRQRDVILQLIKEAPVKQEKNDGNIRNNQTRY